MVLNIDNQSGFLNDYHFQTLCLLYYPGEKFPPGESDAVNRASFKVIAEENDGVKSFTAEVTLAVGSRSESGFCRCDRRDFSFDADDAFAAQAAVGKAFLQAGKRLFSFTPPWGYLTGLRPVKRARYYLERGFDDEAVLRLFTEDHEVAEDKARLSIEIAKTETEMLKHDSPKDCGLYVAIPFCPTRCEYCSFVSYSNQKLFKTLPDYLVRLDEDLRRTAAVIKELGFNLKSVYIGGGTPSILNEEQTAKLFSRITESFDLSKLKEFSYESGRPDTTTKEKLEIAKSFGVDRVSINPQSTNDTILERVGRKHTAKQFFEVAEIAKKVGFFSLNADLIAGLPGDSYDGFMKSLEDVIGLGFDNITVHTLSIKNAAPIRFDEADIYDAAGDVARSCVSAAGKRLREAGLSPYYLYRQKNTIGNAENTGFAMSGKEGYYNVIMMEETSTVFACGASAITKLVSPDGTEIDRIAFPKYPFEYLAAEQGIGEERIRRFFKD